MTQIISIVEQIGRGGGGKVTAVFKRMNLFAEHHDFQPILLSLEHHPRLKSIFLELQSEGRIAPGVHFVTLPDASAASVSEGAAETGMDWPEYDQVIKKSKKQTYLHRNEIVMEDWTKPTLSGELTRRSATGKQGRFEALLLNGVVEIVKRQNEDGTIETTDFSGGVPVRLTKSKDGKFIMGRNLITGKWYGNYRPFTISFYEMVQRDNSIVFFDGITSHFLAEVTEPPRAFFMHEDHLKENGEFPPRIRHQIEKFQGEAIITATNAQKKQLAADCIPAAKIYVIPHVCEVDSEDELPRKNLVTLSRLDRWGKPINECIYAFSRIKDEFPDINYLIYGEGGAKNDLEKIIKKFDCKDRVKLMGYTTDPYLVFRGAIAAAYPTLTEGFGLAILEALACGCPVISYDVNYGPRELIKHGKNGELVKPGDIDSLSQSMRNILKNPKPYQNSTANGLERYSKNAYSKNYLNLVTELLQ